IRRRVIFDPVHAAAPSSRASSNAGGRRRNVPHSRCESPMKLDDLKNKPTPIDKYLRISGPPGANPGTGGITVQTRVASPHSDVVHSETIQQVPNAVVPAC